MGIVAAVDITGAGKKDGKTNSAYTYAIITAAAGVGGIGVMIVSILAYISIRTARLKHLDDVKNYEKMAEQKLGITADKLITMVPEIK
jgi:hypothetical protein